MKNILDIEVTEYSDIMRAIFKRDLIEITHKKNNFPYVPSVGFYEHNQVKLQVGIVFETPTGRESKIFPYLNINRKETINSGECKWVANELTPITILDTIKTHLDSEMLDLVYTGTPLKKRLNNIKYFVVSTGSGGLPLYRLDKDTI